MEYAINAVGMRFGPGCPREETHSQHTQDRQDDQDFDQRQRIASLFGEKNVHRLWTEHGHLEPVGGEAGVY